jgi:hypothetical protein
MAGVEALTITSDGSRVAIGFRTSLTVLDVASGKDLLVANGRWPVLSPDGRAVAYVDHHRLVIRDLDTGVQRYPMKGWLTYGVGGWSPDGKFLLAGSWVALSPSKRLVIVDPRVGGFIELSRLGEGDYGNRCAWISKQLVSATDKLASLGAQQ